MHETIPNDDGRIPCKAVVNTGGVATKGVSVVIPGESSIDDEASDVALLLLEPNNDVATRNEIKQAAVTVTTT